jgi:fucose 4-O-acetylase-like acetyltransferase
LDQAPHPERLDWVDTARGLGIILVVYAHALRGQVSSGAFDLAWHAGAQDRVIYAFHMPLFFFLAGLFAQRSLAKGTPAFLRDKAVTLVYPYFLWATISILLAIAAAGATNGPPGNGGDIIRLWYTPVYQYWFLYALLICQLVTLATRADWRVAVFLCLLSAYFGSRLPLGSATPALNYYLYFGLGLLLSSRLLAWRPKAGVLVALALASWTFLAISFLVEIDAPERLMGVLRAFAGSSALIAASMLLVPHARWLAILGTASMSIYVLHTIFSAGVRMALRAVAFPDDLIALVLGTFVGIVAPLIIWALARQYRLLPWLGLGAQPRILQDARP